MTTECPDSQYCYPINNHGFCTIGCGEGADAFPDGGDQLCEATPALGGTPSCVDTLSTVNSDAGYTFYCGLLCGNLDGVDEGTCPAKLTCTENICQ